MKTLSPHVAIVILAAGESRRMGEPKQLLSWKKTTLIEHVVKNVLEVNVNDVAVVLGAHYNEINKQLKDYPVKIINNNLWNSGLGHSISKAVLYFMSKKSKIEALMIILADQPFVTSAYLMKMIDSFTPNNKQILATQYNDGKLGVPVLFDNFYFTELSELSKDEGAHLIIKKNKNFVDILKASFVNMDIDSKEDYHKAKAQNFSK
ncbi:nucleotidyltransferase family protein [Flavisericum labens]|uniref:nucleotidyltransferase family protein n=1 Tax=Flavisericum labens TaxID=3377112 RepID=UPI00387B59B4